MRFALRLFLTLSLIWCGLHVAEPAQASAAHSEQGSVSQLLDADCGEQGDSERSGHLHHHHCPIASDPAAAAGDLPPLSAMASPLAAPIPALHSLTRAPPLQPPLA